jgi:catechol-2,3-dioxygenase
VIRANAEIVLVVEDVPAAAAFYRDVIGLSPEGSADAEWAWFWIGHAGGSRLGLHRGRLLFEEHSPRPSGRRWGPVHFALQIDRDRLIESVERVRAHGYQVYGPVHFDWMAADGYYSHDLDAGQVEFWSPQSSWGESMEALVSAIHLLLALAARPRQTAVLAHLLLEH